MFYEINSINFLTTIHSIIQLFLFKMKISLFYLLFLKSTAYCVYWPPLSSSRHECHVTDAQVNLVNFNDIKSAFHFIHSFFSSIHFFFTPMYIYILNIPLYYIIVALNPHSIIIPKNNNLLEIWIHNWSPETKTTISTN